MCFYGCQRKQAFALYIINTLVFVTEVESVYCAVCTESLYMAFHNVLLDYKHL